MLALTPATAAAQDIVEGGWYEPELPVPVLHLEGSIEEVARAHGALVGRRPRAKETLEFLAGRVEDRLRASPSLAGHPILQLAARWLYRHFIRAPMIESVPDRYRAAYADFAKAAGIDEDRLWDAIVLPDAALRSVSILYKTELAPILPADFGCTSVVWNSGPASVLHGRNLDYEGVGYWDRNPLILHVIPHVNDGLAYIAVTALGIHAPGITAFNEAGLTLAIHQLTFDDTQAAGTPLAVISAEVIRNARTIDDAIAIIRGFPRAGGWAYVLSQGRDRAVVESSAHEIAIRRTSEPFFFQTNHVSSPALASHQIFYSAGSWLDSFERADRLGRFSRTDAARGWATPEKIAALISHGEEGDRGSPARVAGGTIPKLDNIQSVIMDASHRRLWIAVGTDRLAPNENTYIEYRWSDLRSAAPPEVTGAEVGLLPEEGLGAELAKLRAILRRTVSHKTTPEARARLLDEYAQAVQESAKGGVPTTGTWSGVYLSVFEGLRVGPATAERANRLLGRLELALRDADLAESPGMSVIARRAAQHRLSVGRLHRARLLDLLGRRAEALFEYQVVARTAAFARLRGAAEKGVRSPYDWNRARTLAIDWAGVDLFAY